MTDPKDGENLPESTGEAGSGVNREQVLRATAWTVGSYVAGNVLRLVSNLILARLLFPEAFALLALAAILMQGLRMFSDIGIGPSIIQSRRGEDSIFLNTAWTMQVIRGAWLFVAGCGLAFPFAQFYAEPELLWIVPVAAFPSIIGGFNSTALFAANRRLELGRIAMLGLGESVVKLVVTVTWALLHPSVWAILGGVIVSQASFTVATHLMLPSPQHRLIWNREAVTELVRFGGWVFLSTAVTFFGQQADRLMLGKLVPLGTLGVYSIALMFSRLPIEICGAVTEKVMFPALAAVARNTPERMADVLFRTRRTLLTIGAAATVGFMAISPWFFHFAYDERYATAVWMAPMLGFAMWFGILQASSDRALLALGETSTLFRSNLTNFVVTVGACLLGFRAYGMPGFIAGFCLGNLAGHLVVATALLRLRLLKVSQDLLYTSVVVIAAMAGVWLPANWSMDINTPEGFYRLTAQSGLSVVAGLVALYALRDVLRKR
jgi:O-antigen/teichoic acid export membrane protein